MALEVTIEPQASEPALMQHDAGRSKVGIRRERRTRAGRGRGVREQQADWADAAEAERQRRVDEVRDAERRLVTAHLDDFAPAGRPLLPAPEAVDEGTLRDQQVRALVGEVSRFNRKAREAAQAKALRSADAQIGRLRLARIDALQRAQEHSDAMWQRLLGHDPVLVTEALRTTYAEHDAPIEIVDVWSEGDGHGVDVVVLVGGLDIVPRMTIATSSSGQEVRARDLADVHACYRGALGSTVLATVARTLAASPATDVVNVVVARREAGGPSDGQLSAVYVGGFPRAVVDRADWNDLDPAAEVLESSGAWVQLSGSNREVMPLDLRNEPAVSAALAAVPSTMAPGPRTTEIDA